MNLQHISAETTTAMTIKITDQFPVLKKLSVSLKLIFFLVLSLLIIMPVLGQTRNAAGNFSKDTTVVISGVSVDISWPAGKVKGCILVLPGWNFSRKDVCTNSDFCKLARQEGYCLIRPEMAKSAYIVNYFKETREDYMRNPRLSWVVDTMIPYLQKTMRILLPGEKNFLFGISTGGRGAAQIAIHTGKLFTAGAALSGDYNQLLQKDDKLMTGYLGSYDAFPSRWTGEDNPFMHAVELKIPLYLGHGEADKIVPVEQTKTFFEKISFMAPRLGHILHIGENSGHNYNYWNSEMHSIFAFFKKKT